MTTLPRLRSIDIQPIQHQGQPMWLLRDPWELSEKRLVIPHTLVSILRGCDGTRTPEDIHHDLEIEMGEKIPPEVTHHALAALDEAYLLDNERSQNLVAELVAQYWSQPYRPPALAGLGYPDQPQRLEQYLNGFMNGSRSGESGPSKARGIISPHIDYPRGGPVYGQVWQQAIPSVRQADLVVILGTDHNGTAGSLTLTKLPYATPYGVIPNDPHLIDALADAIGSQAAYAEELNHRGEHSVELSAVWLHHICHLSGIEPPPMVPILVGSFYHHIVNMSHPADDQRLNRFLATLHRESESRSVLVVASVDLAHLGRNFGDAFILDDARREQTRQEDHALLDSIMWGDAARFFGQIADVKDRNRICGFSPIYTMLSFLGATNGLLVTYQQCPADALDTSLVSISGVLLV